MSSRNRWVPLLILIAGVASPLLAHAGDASRSSSTTRCDERTARPILDRVSRVSLSGWKAQPFELDWSTTLESDPFGIPVSMHTWVAQRSFVQEKSGDRIWMTIASRRSTFYGTYKSIGSYYDAKKEKLAIEKYGFVGVELKGYRGLKKQYDNELVDLYVALDAFNTLVWLQGPSKHVEPARALIEKMDLKQVDALGRACRTL